MGNDPAEQLRQRAADELTMGLTEKECRSALLMLTYATTSLAGENGDNDDDAGLNAIQAAIAEDVTMTAIREVLAQTRGIAVPAPGLEVSGRTVRPLKSARPRKQPGLPEIIT